MTDDLVDGHRFTATLTGEDLKNLQLLARREFGSDGREFCAMTLVRILNCLARGAMKATPMQEIAFNIVFDVPDMYPRE